MAHPSATSRCVTPELFKGLLTENSSVATEQLGRSRIEWDVTAGYQKYVYVQNSTATALADGTTCYWADDFRTKVSISESQNKKAGIAFGAITASYHGWIQVGGYHDAVKAKGGDANDGDFMVFDAADGFTNALAAGGSLLEQPFGVAVGDDAASLVPMMILLDVVY